MRRSGGAANPLLLLASLPVLLVVGLQGVPERVNLKAGPLDAEQLNALLICVVIGCAAQAAWLLAHIGDDVPRPAGRWIGEISLGGFAAYLACEAFLYYGPDVKLPQLIVPAVLGGFLGQRLMILGIDWATARFKLPSVRWSGPPARPPDPPPPGTPPGGDPNAP